MLTGLCKQLDMRLLATQLTSLSLALSYSPADETVHGMSQIWELETDMLAVVSQLTELRHLDIGNCNLVPESGGRLILPFSSWFLVFKKPRAPQMSGPWC